MAKNSLEASKLWVVGKVLSKEIIQIDSILKFNLDFVVILGVESMLFQFEVGDHSVSQTIQREDTVEGVSELTWNQGLHL